ncbi:MAG: septum site-determining protein MinC [Synergistaceae bacterium]|nr:septum site-determining protein MinC [Synergistaceae bacterium]
MASAAIILKGAGYGIRLFVSEDAPETQIIDEIRGLPEQSFNLATGYGIIVDLQSRQCSGSLISSLLMELVWNRNINILSWNSYHSDTLGKLKAAKFTTGEFRPPSDSENPDEAENSALPPLFRHRSLRSGEKIEHDGDVVVFGHVNNGAEIIASGSISIFGKLKGLAHAGVNIRESNEAFIFAHSFEPQQVRLGNLVNSKIGDQMPWWRKSVLIFMEEGSLIIREL